MWDYIIIDSFFQWIEQYLVNYTEIILYHVKFMATVYGIWNFDFFA